MTHPDGHGKAGQQVARLMARQSVRFVLVGGSAAVLYFVLFTLAMQQGGDPVPAALLAYATSFLASYLAQKRFAFRSATGHATSLPRYALLQCGCAAAATSSAALAVRLGVSDARAIGLVTTLALGMVSYVLSSRWVFVR